MPYLRRCDTISIFSYDFIELKTMKTTRDKFAFLAIVVADFFSGEVYWSSILSEGYCLCLKACLFDKYYGYKLEKGMSDL